MIKIGLLGLGTVGVGVYEIINCHRGNYFKHTEDEINITKILVRDMNKKRSVNIDSPILTTNAEDILLDPEIDIVISVMGGMEPAYKYMLKALENGKHVITANKAVVSEYLPELLEVAKENNVSFLFEASVGGGIPIINTLKETLKINKIDEIKGILNGTTNFILSKMVEEGSDFDDTLRLAQEMGFAEADPTADIEGFDVSRKLAILSSIAYGTLIKDQHIYKRGIKGITKSDIDMFKQFNYVIKYLAHSFTKGNNYYATVEPILVTSSSIISNVNQEFNIVSINGNIIGELQFYGKGAGKDATANAVVGDLLYTLNNKFMRDKISLQNKVKHGGVSEFIGKYYLRINIENNNQFSTILDIIDEDCKDKKIIFNENKIIILTQPIKADLFNDMIDKIKNYQNNLFYARIIA